MEPITVSDENDSGNLGSRVAYSSFNVGDRVTYRGKVWDNRIGCSGEIKSWYIACGDVMVSVHFDGEEDPTQCYLASLKAEKSRS